MPNSGNTEAISWKWILHFLVHSESKAKVPFFLNTSIASIWDTLLWTSKPLLSGFEILIPLQMINFEWLAIGPKYLRLLFKGQLTGCSLPTLTTGVEIIRFTHLSFKHLNKSYPWKGGLSGWPIYFVLQTAVDNTTSRRSLILAVMQKKPLQPAWELNVLVEGVFGCLYTVNRFTLASVSMPGKLILVSEMCKGSYHVWDWTGIHRSEEKELSSEYFNLLLNTLTLKPDSSQVLQLLSSAHNTVWVWQKTASSFMWNQLEEKNYNINHKNKWKKEAALKTRNEKISNKAKQLCCK